MGSTFFLCIVILVWILIFALLTGSKTLAKIMVLVMLTLASGYCFTLAWVMVQKPAGYCQDSIQTEVYPIRSISQSDGMYKIYTETGNNRYTLRTVNSDSTVVITSDGQQKIIQKYHTKMYYNYPWTVKFFLGKDKNEQVDTKHLFSTEIHIHTESLDSLMMK